MFNHAANKLYQDVCQYARRTATLNSVNDVLGWDERTQMPPAGAEHRAEQSTVLAGLIHQRWIDPKFGEQLEELSQSIEPCRVGTAHQDLSEVGGAHPTTISISADPHSDMAVVVHRLKRLRDKRVKLPQSLVEDLARTAILGQQAWQEAREKDDFPAFRPLLEHTIELNRQQAECLGYPQCPYDALLDEYEPEELTADVGKVLDGLRAGPGAIGCKNQAKPAAAEHRAAGARLSH